MPGFTPELGGRRLPANLAGGKPGGCSQGNGKLFFLVIPC